MIDDQIKTLLAKAVLAFAGLLMLSALAAGFLDDAVAMLEVLGIIGLIVFGIAGIPWALVHLGDRKLEDK